MKKRIIGIDVAWASFMLFGLWYGKQDLNDHRLLKRSLWASGLIFIFVQLVSNALLNSTSHSLTQDLISDFVGTSPMPPMPLYMLTGLSISIVTIASCTLIAKRFEDNKVILAFNKTGQLALTFYVAHVVIGMGLVEVFGPLELENYSIEFSFYSAAIFCLICILFAVIWLHYKKSGPLEWAFRKLTN